MNVNRKTLILAIAAGMGIIPVAGVFAAVPATPLGKDPGATTVVGPINTPAESKENSASYNIVYDDATLADAKATVPIVVGDTVNKGGDLNTYIYTMPGYVVKAAETKSLTVKVTLTGGAKFVKAPYLICVHSGDANSPAAGVKAVLWGDIKPSPVAPISVVNAATAYKIPTTNTTPGLASYNFYFPEGFTVTEKGSGACLLAFSALPTMAAGDAALVPALTLPAAATDVSLNVDVIYDDFFTKQTKSTAISMLSFTTAYKAEFDKAKTIPTIDVAALSKKFLLGSTTEFGGHVIVNATKDALNVAKEFRNASGFGLSAANVVSAVSLTFTGPPIATLSKVSLNSANVANSFCTTKILDASPAAVSGGSSDTITVSIPFGTSAYGTLVSANAGILTHDGTNVCLVVDGTKIMSEGYVSITVNGITADGGKVVELGTSPPDFIRVKRNGAVVRVLNVPGDPKDPFRVNIRMFNTSNQTVNNVLGTLYGVDGKVIADGVVLAASIAPNNMKLITSDSLLTLSGKTWTGRAWMIIQAPVDPSGFKVQVLMKQPSGVLSNLSTDAID